MELRGAIPCNHGATKTGSWDGPANEAKLKGDASVLRQAYAWFDKGKDPDTKDAYKFIHHFVDADGKPGAASTVACSAGIAVLNGGRGGTTIPAADRKGVYAHLAGHLKDAGLTPPELKSIDGGYEPEGFESQMIERRFTPGTFGLCEVRAASGQSTIGGHAAVFNKLSRNLGGFVEQLDPATFNYAAAQGFPDVVARFNHDDLMILGTTNARTLRLAIDSVGLAYDVTPPRTRADVVELVERGDAQKSSFAFRTVSDDWGMTEQGFPLRTLLSVELVDVAPVVTPAYPDADAGLRSLARHVDAPLAEVRKLAQGNELVRFFKRSDMRWSASPLSATPSEPYVGGDQNQLPLPEEVLPEEAKQGAYEPKPYAAEADECVMCLNCDCLNSDDARFCDQCGMSLTEPGNAEVMERADNPSDEDDEGGEPEDEEGKRADNPSDESGEEGGEPEDEEGERADKPSDGDPDDNPDGTDGEGDDDESRAQDSGSEAAVDAPPALTGAQAIVQLLARRQSP